jgi:hypothetical protein
MQPRPANGRDDGSMETSQFRRRQQGPAVDAARKRRLDEAALGDDVENESPDESPRAPATTQPPAMSEDDDDDDDELESITCAWNRDMSEADEDEGEGEDEDAPPAAASSRPAGGGAAGGGGSGGGVKQVAPKKLPHVVIVSCHSELS